MKRESVQKCAQKTRMPGCMHCLDRASEATGKHQEVVPIHHGCSCWFLWKWQVSRFSSWFPSRSCLLFWKPSRLLPVFLPGHCDGSENLPVCLPARFPFASRFGSESGWYITSNTTDQQTEKGGTTA
jgi:hypothetical protein